MKLLITNVVIIYKLYNNHYIYTFLLANGLFSISIYNLRPNYKFLSIIYMWTTSYQ